MQPTSWNGVTLYTRGFSSMNSCYIICNVRVKARLHDLLRKDEEFDSTAIEQVRTHVDE
jgi:hypothetical protein